MQIVYSRRELYFKSHHAFSPRFNYFLRLQNFGQLLSHPKPFYMGNKYFVHFLLSFFFLNRTWIMWKYFPTKESFPLTATTLCIRFEKLKRSDVRRLPSLGTMGPNWVPPWNPSNITQLFSIERIKRGSQSGPHSFFINRKNVITNQIWFDPISGIDFSCVRTSEVTGKNRLRNVYPTPSTTRHEVPDWNILGVMGSQSGPPLNPSKQCAPRGFRGGP